MTTTLIIPGLASSGAAHWQTWLESQVAGAVRVEQSDWHDANLADWSRSVRSAISKTRGRIFIAAHSFGALAAVQAANDYDHRIAGALLVAPADPDKFAVADYLPSGPLAFPTIVVASTNDPWMPVEQAKLWSDRWDAKFVNLGEAGHINVDSGFGPWPQGLALLHSLRRSADTRAANALRPALSTSYARRRNSGATRSASRFHLNDDRRDVQRAAALLEDAGWLVAPPVKEVRVATA